MRSIRVRPLRPAIWLPLLLVVLTTRLDAAEAAPAPAAAKAVPPYVARISGQILHANTLEFSHFALTDVSALPRFENRVLTFTTCTATAYGGAVTGTIAIDFDNDVERCSFDVKDVDLASLLSGLGASVEGIGGKMSGHLEFSLPSGHPELISGRGAVVVKDGSLIELPLIANLLVGDLGAAKGQDGAEATFEIAEGLVRFPAATVTLPKAKLLINGTISLEGDLRLLVIPRVGSFLDFIPGLGRIFDSMWAFASSRVARAVVRGPLSKPVIVINPFAEN